VMSKIQWGKLHSERFGRRHSTLQSHGLFALAKHLLLSLTTQSHATRRWKRCPLNKLQNYVFISFAQRSDGGPYIAPIAIRWRDAIAEIATSKTIVIPAQCSACGN